VRHPRDAGFHLAHKVGAHVGGLGVDATTHTGEERDALGTEAEAREHFEALHHLFKPFALPHR
jgi:hypothetical protein